MEHLGRRRRVSEGSNEGIEVGSKERDGLDETK
jgi:hypothetical protein